MADKFDKTKRSDIMSKVHSTNTTPEMVLRHILSNMGYRYRIHRKDLPGTPDIVLSKYRLVINVNGCFWHGCPYCKHARIRPVSNEDYWNKKLDRNIQRDKENQLALETLGWKILVVWECETKKKNRTVLTEKLRDVLTYLS
jgi:DNA mismatch endonuclease (patch repair protein)